MNLVTTDITNAFQTLPDDATSHPDNLAYNSNSPPPLMDPTPNASVMNRATSTVSDLTLQTLQQQMQLMQQMMTQTTSL